MLRRGQPPPLLHTSAARQQPPAPAGPAAALLTCRMQTTRKNQRPPSMSALIESLLRQVGQARETAAVTAARGFPPSCKEHRHHRSPSSPAVPKCLSCALSPAHHRTAAAAGRPPAAPAAAAAHETLSPSARDCLYMASTVESTLKNIEMVMASSAARGAAVRATGQSAELAPGVQRRAGKRRAGAGRRLPCSSRAAATRPAAHPA